MVADAGAPVVVRDVAELEPSGRGRPGRPCRRRPADPDDLAALFYTSGTTGRPKGVRLSHRALIGASRLGALNLLPGSDGRHGPAHRPHHGLRLRSRVRPRGGAGRRARPLRCGQGPRPDRGPEGRHLRGRARHVPAPAGGRRRGAGPAQRPPVAVGSRRHAPRPGPAVPAPRLVVHGAGDGTGRAGGVRRGLRPGRVSRRGRREGPRADAGAGPPAHRGRRRRAAARRALPHPRRRAGGAGAHRHERLLG